MCQEPRPAETEADQAQHRAGPQELEQLEEQGHGVTGPEAHQSNALEGWHAGPLYRMARSANQ